MMVAVISCGKTKEPVTKRAEDLYISPYAQEKAQVAQEFFDQAYILSAWYGLVPAHMKLQPYEAKISDVNQETWIQNVERHLKLHSLLTEDVELWSLCPKTYHQAGTRSYREILEDSEVKAVFPFDATSGIGYQRQWMQDCLTQGKLTHPEEGNYV